MAIVALAYKMPNDGRTWKRGDRQRLYITRWP
jgi:hypothetical protein